MTAENRPNKLPEWLRRERQRDREWIVENLHIFWPAATAAFKEHGRGAIVVDTTVRPTGRGNPFGYFPQAVVDTGDDEDIKRMVREYDPEREFVLVMLKPAEDRSTYRVQPTSRTGENRKMPTSRNDRPRREYFTRPEAEGKVGRQVRTRVEFSGVPQGTTGHVISADPAGYSKTPDSEAAEVYDVAVQWDLPRPAPFADLVIPAGAAPYIHIQTGKPLIDWFTKDEYERYLDELPEEAGVSHTTGEGM